MLQLHSLLLHLLVISTFYQFASTKNPCNKHNNWQCDNGQCIRTENRCDGRRHCRDGSDEIAEYCVHLPCPKYAFRCAYGACITGTHRCNGVSECADNSDETSFLCNDLEYELDKLMGNCSSSMLMQCKSGECIPADARCDGILDCIDGSDETVGICSHLSCPSYAFLCGYGGCIRGNAKCDGVVDCPDGSDEAAELCGYERNWNRTTIDVTIIVPPKKRPRGEGCWIPYNRKHLIVENELNNQIFKLGDRVSSGTSVKLSCSHDFKLNGEQKIVCENNRWQDTLPYCNKHCDISTIKGVSTTISCEYHGKFLNCSKPLRRFTKAHISCAPGYELAENKEVQSILTCDQDAEWDYPKVTCTAQCANHTAVTADGTQRPKMTWDVSIFQRSFSPVFEYTCTAAIVSAKLAISLASCFKFISEYTDKPYDPVYFNIVEGSYRKAYTQGDNIGSVVHNISEIAISNNQYNSSALSEDLAIIVLNNYFEFSTHQLPFCLQLREVDLDDDETPYEIIFVRQSYVDSAEYGAAMEYFSVNQNKSKTGIIAKKSPDIRLQMLNINFFREFIKKYMERYEYVL